MRGRWSIGWLALIVVAISGRADGPLAATATNHVAQPVPPAPPPPLPPSAPSPVEQFRRLLAMSPAERDQWLAGRSEKARAYLRAQLQEFDALTPPEREIRLRLLRLRYYLVPLMKSAPADRQVLLARVPATERALIVTRLTEWDRLPADQQQELLQDEKALDSFSVFNTATEAERRAMIERATPERRQRLEAELARWQSLAPGQRERLARHFDHFFSLADPEREKVLGLLSAGERRRTERMLAAFGQLPPEQRTRCIAALNRFVTMTTAEREQFWRKAARWESMTPAERRAWRAFTADLPPMPPGLGPGQPAPPPLPPPPPAARPPTNAQVAN